MAINATWRCRRCSRIMCRCIWPEGVPIPEGARLVGVCGCNATNVLDLREAVGPIVTATVVAISTRLN